jgi:hypothetical protein
MNKFCRYRIDVYISLIYTCEYMKLDKGSFLTIYDNNNTFP